MMPRTVRISGDDNQLLRLDEGALKVLDLHLNNCELWHLAWAMDLVRKVKEGRRVEAVDW